MWGSPFFLLVPIFLLRAVKLNQSDIYGADPPPFSHDLTSSEVSPNTQMAFLIPALYITMQYIPG